jgi:hypothetical protein
VEVFWRGRCRRTTNRLDMTFGAGVVNGALRAKTRALTKLWPGHSGVAVFATGIFKAKALPEIVWRSVQWHNCRTAAENDVISQRIAPQAQPPVMGSTGRVESTGPLRSNWERRLKRPCGDTQP